MLEGLLFIMLLTANPQEDKERAERRCKMFFSLRLPCGHLPYSFSASPTLSVAVGYKSFGYVSVSTANACNNGRISVRTQILTLEKLRFRVVSATVQCRVFSRTGENVDYLQRLAPRLICHKFYLPSATFTTWLRFQSGIG